MQEEVTKLPDIISPDTNFSSREKINASNSRQSRLEDYNVGDDSLGGAPTPYDVTFKDSSFDNQTAPQLFRVWAEHQQDSRADVNSLNNGKNDSNNLIKPYLNEGVYEKSNIEIQSIMQRHRIRSSNKSGKKHKPRGQNRSLANTNLVPKDLIYVPQHANHSDYSKSGSRVQAHEPYEMLLVKE